MSNNEYKMTMKGKVLDFGLYSWSKLSFLVTQLWLFIHLLLLFFKYYIDIWCQCIDSHIGQRRATI